MTKKDEIKKAVVAKLESDFPNIPVRMLDGGNPLDLIAEKVNAARGEDPAIHLSERRFDAGHAAEAVADWLETHESFDPFYHGWITDALRNGE